MSLRNSVGAWVRRHQRAARFGLIGATVVLLGVAGFLGWALVSGLSPGAQSGSSSRPSASASEVPSVSEAPSASPAIPSTSATATPLASPSIVTGFDFNDILRVEVNNLAVRAAPTRSSPLMHGYRYEDGFVPLGEIRLDAGDFVSAQLGPLPIGDTVWYLVWPSEDARLHYSLVSWSTAGIAGANEPGWVAASVGADQYLSFYQKPDPSEYDAFSPDGPRTLFESGTGDYESDPQIRYDLYALNWAVSVGDERSPCAFTVSLVPEDEGVEPVVAADVKTTDVAQGPTQGEESIPDTPWGASAGRAWDTFVVQIRTGCTWTLSLEPLAHD